LQTLSKIAKALNLSLTVSMRWLVSFIIYPLVGETVMCLHAVFLCDCE
jgi:hypothetical protein